MKIKLRCQSHQYSFSSCQRHHTDKVLRYLSCPAIVERASITKLFIVFFNFIQSALSKYHLLSLSISESPNLTCWLSVLAFLPSKCWSRDWNKPKKWSCSSEPPTSFLTKWSIRMPLTGPRFGTTKALDVSFLNFWMVYSYVWPLSNHGCRPINWNWTQIKLNSFFLGTNNSRPNTSLCFQLSFSVSKLTLLNLLVISV